MSTKTLPPESKSDAAPSSLRSEIEVVRSALIAAMKGRCAEAYLGLKGPTRLSILTDEDEMREMTRCEEYPKGLDFSTGHHTSRAILYDLRDEMAEDMGLYFIGEARVGIKWTAFAPRGLAWRVGEFSERAQAIVHQIAGWCATEAARTQNKDAARKIARVGEIFREMEQEIRRGLSEAEGVMSMLPGAQLADDESDVAAD